MLSLCKFTRQDMTTKNKSQWQVGVPAPALPGSLRLCDSGWYHCYEHPLLAAFFKLIHVNPNYCRLWRVWVGPPHSDLFKTDRGVKRGYMSMTLVEEIEVPKVTHVNRVAFGILCALEVTESLPFRNWAESWLSGEDRSLYTADRVAKNLTGFGQPGYLRHAITASVSSYYSEWSGGTAASEAARAAPIDKPIDLTSIAHMALTYE